ncbi:MAG TPA: AbrB/MazE/SpoVT family DNA-binding domain-containing protein [Candidatus Binatia bacterium]|nr:AbrB/MazE/SpoVT family DNA-binding domain-containing protein [Candidatus Binatia bacterium]
MRVQVQKWGNSLALRIPKPFAAEVRVEEGTLVDLSVVKEKLVATPIPRKKTTLSQLLAKVSRANLHGEVETGPAVGREA